MAEHYAACAGVDREAVLKTPLWELFTLRGANALPAGLAADAAANREFTVSNVVLRAPGAAGGAPGSPPPASSGSPALSTAGQLFTLGFRWGANTGFADLSASCWGDENSKRQQVVDIHIFRTPTR